MAFAPKAQASDYRYGFSIGYGGENLSGNYTDSSGATRKVSRTDGPLMLDVFIDKFLSDSFLINIAHSRGIGVSPVTSGISFTGVTGQWYLLGPVTAVSASSDTTLFIKRWAPYAGISAGFAQASMTRDNDPIPTANGSGIYLGTKLGFDYPTGPGRGLKPEIAYASTTFTNSFSSSATTPPALTQFSFQCSWYFDF